MNDSPEWNATATEIEGFSCANWGCDHHECRHLRVAAAGLRRYADVWLFPPSGPEDDDLDRAAAARLRQLTDENDRWQEEARQYAENADYWRDRLNDHKASLAIQAFTAPDEDEAVMMESLVARIGDLLAERDEYRRQLDTLRNAIEKLIPWAESYRMHHVVMALRELLALAAVGDPEEGR